MAVNSLLPPVPLFCDASGAPLEGGYIYVGQPGFEARSTPKSSFFDKAATIPTGTDSGAAIRTVGGYPARNGAAAMVYVDADFSITVTDKNGVVVFAALNRSFEFAFLATASILAPDGNFSNAGFGYVNEPNTGHIRASAGVEQDIILGNLVSQRQAEGTQFLLPAFGAGVRYLSQQPELPINGNFDIWQRGSSFATVGYGADRWRNDFVGGASVMSSQSFSAGDTLGTVNPKLFCRMAVSGQSAVSDRAYLEHRIEDVRTLAGQTITLFFWARRSVGTGNIAVEMVQSFGTGGSPSAAVQVAPVAVSITASWAVYRAVFALPSIVGKTLGSNGDDYLSINVWLSAGSNFNARTNNLGIQTITADFWGFHIREGDLPISVSDNYRPPSFGDTLRRCQRYFYRPNTTYFLSGYGPGGQSLRNQIWFPVTMRATPVSTVNWTGLANASVVALADLGNMGANAGINAVGAGPATFSGSVNWASFDAEL
jgi:hypothetical protein